MNLFFDTSALVKLFSVEEGSEAVKKIITSPENTINLLHGLRTLDALHVAGWRIVAEPGWTFVSSDKNQLNVVTQLNGKTIAV